jgi:hypothetical protein
MHGEIAEQARQHVRVVQDALLQRRDAGEAELIARLDQTSLDRRPRVVAEVVMVVLKQRLQQQLDF